METSHAVQQVVETDNGVQRRTDLVAHVVDEDLLKFLFSRRGIEVGDVAQAIDIAGGLTVLILTGRDKRLQHGISVTRQQHLVCLPLFHDLVQLSIVQQKGTLLFAEFCIARDQLSLFVIKSHTDLQAGESQVKQLLTNVL